MPETTTCPYCAEEIKPEAIVCKHCGRSLTAEETVKDKNPKIGLLGIVLMILAVPFACAGDSGIFISIIIGIVGAGILIYAIASGNIKLFG